MKYSSFVVAASLALCMVQGRSEAKEQYPVAAALAGLLQPHAKHLKKMSDHDKGAGDSDNVWEVDEGTVPGAGGVTLGRLKMNPTGWSFNLTGETKAEDYGTVEKLCSGGTTADGIPKIYYRITSGPLKGALLCDGVRGEFTVQNGVYNTGHAWGWKCGGQVLQ